MSPRGPHATLLLLLLLLTLTASWLAVDEQEAPYPKLQRQHVDECPQPSDPGPYHSKMMKDRNITPGQRKEICTFIHADIAKINAIHGTEGNNAYGNHCYSSYNFGITECMFMYDSPPSDCEYTGCVRRGQTCIVCTRNKPARYTSPQNCTMAGAPQPHRRSKST